MRRAREDPVSVGHSVAFYAGGVGSARWPVGYQDALGQAYRDDWLTIPQVLQWVAVNDYVDAGRVGVVRLELGSPPGPDSSVRRTQKSCAGFPNRSLLTSISSSTGETRTGGSNGPRRSVASPAVARARHVRSRFREACRFRSRWARAFRAGCACTFE